MAMTSEEIQLRIVASGSAAKKELADLGQTQEDLKRKIEGLNKKSKDYTATKRKLETELKSVNERMRKLRGEMDLNGMSMRDLRNRANDLKRVMDNMNPDTPEWKRLNADLQRVNGRMKELRGSTQQLRGGFDGLKGMLGKGLAIGVAVQGARELFEIGKRAITAFTQQAQAVEKVNQAIKSTAGAAGFSLSQLRKEASELQKRTLFGDEDVLNNATAQLLTFTNIAGDNFLRTQRVALDLSTVLDGDLKSASIQLGKALNDPVANLSALSRSGIQFSAAQKAVIKDLAESNRLAEAQAVILDELERQYGGQAEAAARVGGGWQQLGNVLGDTMEELGGFITALFNTETATGSLLDIFSNFNERMREWTENIGLARQWMRDWYDESAVVRVGVQMLATNLKTTLLWVMQVIDAIVVQPFQLVVAGIKAARLMMDGEFKQAANVLKDHAKYVLNDWKEFGSEVKTTITDAWNEVRDPKPWQDMGDNAQKEVTRVKEAIDEAKAAIDAFIASDTLDSDEEIQLGSTDDPVVKKWFEARQQVEEMLAEMRRTQRQQEIYEETIHWNELIDLNEKYATGATDLENRKRAALAAINKKWDDQEIAAAKAKEAALLETKMESFRQVAQGTSQMLGFMGQYMEKGSAAAKITAGIQTALDLATTISSAISGATEAAAAGGPSAPFLIMGYIGSMVGAVYGAFSQVDAILNSSEDASLDTSLSVPAFAGGTKGGTVTPSGWKLVGEEGPELMYTPGGEKIVTASDTASILGKYNLSNVNSAFNGSNQMPAPSYTIDTTAIGSAIGQPMPSFANGTMGSVGAFNSDVGRTMADGNNVLVAKIDQLIAAVMVEKTRPAIVSQRQMKDREDDLAYIKNFSDIRKT